MWEMGLTAHDMGYFTAHNELLVGGLSRRYPISMIFRRTRRKSKRKMIGKDEEVHYPIHIVRICLRVMGYVESHSKSLLTSVKPK